MNLGPYALTLEGIAGVGLNVFDAFRVHVRGIPRAPGRTPADFARATLKANARGVLWAGIGHFRFMWVSDFGKALRGALHALDHGYLRRQIAYMVRESARLGLRLCFPNKN